MDPVSVYRTITLRGATGKLRAASLQGKDYLVVPVTALMEAVIHPIGSQGRGEFVSRKVLQRSAHTWNGHPCLPDHPMNADGSLLSANSPTVYDAQSFGLTFNAEFKNDRELHMEAWLDPARAAIVGAAAMEVIDKVKAEIPVEVSVGAFVKWVETAGNYKGQPYGVEWIEATGDHLALGLNGGRGACSVDMGCGTMRGNASDMPIYVITPNSDGPELVASSWQEQPRVPAGSTTGGQWIDSAMIPQQVASLSQLQQWREKVKSFLLTFEGLFAEPEPNAQQEPVPEVAPVGASCGCHNKQEPVMHRNADKIKALIDAGPWTADDQPYLESLSDERLEAFGSKSVATLVADSTPTPPAPHPPTPAPAPVPAPPAPPPAPVPAPKALTTAELIESVHKLNDEEFLALLPAAEREFVVAGRANAKERREKMLAGLKAATKDAYTDAELASMDAAQLDKLAKAVGFDPEKVDAPEPEPEAKGARVYDWSGVGGARKIPEGTKLSDFAPPDPWADALKARKGA